MSISSHITILFIFLPFMYTQLFTCVILINFRLQYEGAPKYLGESVTGSKFGYRIDEMVHA